MHVRVAGAIPRAESHEGAVCPTPNAQSEAELPRMSQDAYMRAGTHYVVRATWLSDGDWRKEKQEMKYRVHRPARMP